MIESIIKEELREIELDKIVLNPYQPRRHFEQQELEGLAQSIRAVGIIHPPLVRSLPHSNCYELISGERRYRAAQLIGLARLPVIVRHTSYSISAQAALIENIQRIDLNPIEIAKALRSLMTDFGFNQDEIAQRIGKKRSTVANYLRLLSLPISIQEGVVKEIITMGHAKAILALEGEEKQNLLYEIILRDGLTVRAAEAAAIRLQEKVKKNALNYVTRDFYLEQLAEKIQHRFGTKVSIQGQGKRGRITIDYYNLDDLDRLLILLGVQDAN